MSKIFLAQDGTSYPKNESYYVLGSNGCFLSLNSPMFSSTISSNIDSALSNLKQVKEEFNFKFPLVPEKCFLQIISFFKEVYAEFKSEACVLLYYKVPNYQKLLIEEKKILTEFLSTISPYQNEWTADQSAQVSKYWKSTKSLFNKLKEIDHSECEYVICCPKQKVSAAAVNYSIMKSQPKDLNYNFMLVASIHSHPNFSAYHSSVDDHDEMDWDGLHVTLGYINSKNFQISSSMVLNQHRFNINPTLVFEGIKEYSNNCYNLINEEMLFDPQILDLSKVWIENNVVKGSF